MKQEPIPGATGWLTPLGAAVLALVMANTALGVCPSGLPDQIFCEDFDCYCAGADCTQDPPIKCPEDRSVPKSNGPVRQLWLRTSRNENNNNICGSEFNLEDTLVVYSYPFGVRLPNQLGSQLGHLTVGSAFVDGIRSVHGSESDAVVGTDENPLIVTMNLNNQTGDKIQSANVTWELSLGDDFAPTNYLDKQQECTDCGVVVNQDWARVICAQSVQIPGCPDITTAPVHASIAVGFVAYLDPDPCDCGSETNGSRNDHLSFFDGRRWWILDEGVFPGSGTFTLAGGTGLDALVDLNGAELTLTIMTTTVQIEYTTYNPEPGHWDEVLEYSVATAPREYLGPFDKLHSGLGIGCAIDETGWDNCAAPRRCLRGSPGAGAVIFDDFVMYGGEGFDLPPPIGACCQRNGHCVQTDEETCEADGGIYQGDNLACGVLPCCPRPFADADGDGDVDMTDFAAFQRCLNAGAVDPGCDCFDRGNDGFPDGVIDLLDFEGFADCSTGAEVPFVAAEHPNCEP